MTVQETIVHKLCNIVGLVLLIFDQKYKQSGCCYDLLAAATAGGGWPSSGSRAPGGRAGRSGPPHGASAPRSPAGWPLVCRPQPRI